MLSLNELMNLSCNLGTLKGRILFISFIVLLYNRGPMLEILLSVMRNLLNLISKYCGILLSVCQKLVLRNMPNVCGHDTCL